MKRKLLALIFACLLTAEALLPAAAASSGRSIPVTVDDALLSGTSYLANGVTTVPLRFFCSALDGWQISWDAGHQAAKAVRGGTTITAAIGGGALVVNGYRYDCAEIYIKDGHTYVPLRTLCQALGYDISWNSVLNGVSVVTGESTPSYSQDDLYWLSRIISAESQGEPLVGQIAVGNVVLNRVASGNFPGTIKSVVFDTKDGVQFQPVSLGTVYDQPTDLSVLAAKAALAGTSVVGHCLYFFAPALSQGTWIRANRTYYTTIGCHRFYL